MGPTRLTMFVVAACRFVPGAATNTGAGDGAPRDVAVPPRDQLDADLEPPQIFAFDASTLYTVDVIGMTLTTIGGLHDSQGNSVTNMLSLAYVDGALIAVSHQDAQQSFATIDPTTALVTFSPQPAIVPNQAFVGLTYDPTSHTLLAGTSDTGQLYLGDTSADTMTALGSFGAGMDVYGDLAWLDGTLYGTMTGGPCNATCIATIDPSSGAATVLSTDAPAALPSLSGFHGKLYAISGGGDVYEIATDTGNASFLFNADGKDLGDSAP